MSFEKKSHYLKNIFSSRTFFTILGLLMIFLISFPLANKVSKEYRVNKEIEDLKKEIEKVENKNTDLKQILSYLESDQFVEKEAREKLNYKKEGEEVVVIKDSEIEASLENGVKQKSGNYYDVQDSGSENKVVKENNFNKWVKYFFVN